MVYKIVEYFTPSLKAWLAFSVAWIIDQITFIQSVDLDGLTDLATFITEVFKGLSFMVATIFTVLQIIKYLKKKKE